MIMPPGNQQSNLLRRAINQRLQYPFTNQNSQNNQQKAPVRTSIFYINDYHGKSINMERTVTASNAFDCFVPSQKTDKLKLSSGDIMLGEILPANQVAVEAQKVMGIMASAMGNHEYDMPKDIDKLIPKIGFKL